VERVEEVRQINAHDSSSPLRKVEVAAEYPGGAQGWIKYLSKTLKYPDEAVNNEVQGTVIVEFVVNEDGSLSDIHAISGPGRLRAESVRVITESGKWVPAKDHGVIVASYHKQPINYKLETK
jgi:protein TonB